MYCCNRSRDYAHCIVESGAQSGAARQSLAETQVNVTLISYSGY